MSRGLLEAAALLVLFVAGAPAMALDLSAIRSTDAVSALRTALTQGSTKAVATLGQTSKILQRVFGVK